MTLLSASVGGLRDADRWRRGAEGERRTAALLDGLASRRWAVWHDLQVPGSRANIDHLVVGRTGVWVVDTKTPRGQVRSGWRSVRMGDRRLDTGPVTWEAEMVAERLDERPCFEYAVIGKHISMCASPFSLHFLSIMHDKTLYQKITYIVSSFQ